MTQSAAWAKTPAAQKNAAKERYRKWLLSGGVLVLVALGSFAVVRGEFSNSSEFIREESRADKEAARIETAVLQGELLKTAKETAAAMASAAAHAQQLNATSQQQGQQLMRLGDKVEDMASDQKELIGVLKPLAERMDRVADALEADKP